MSKEVFFYFMKTKDMILIAMFAALITVGAYIKIPVPVCPFTLQFLFTTLAGIILGAKNGTIAVSVYVLLGLAGLPVFTGGGGIGLYFSLLSDISLDLLWEHLLQVR